MATTHELPRPLSATAPLAATGLALAGLVIFAGNYDVQPGENGGTGPAIVTAVICVVLAAVLFGYVVPRARNHDRIAFVLGLVGFVSLAAFWSGVTPVLAAAALAVAPRSASPDRKASVGQALAGFATVAAVVVTLAQSHLF